MESRYQYRRMKSFRFSYIRSRFSDYYPDEQAAVPSHHPKVDMASRPYRQQGTWGHIEVHRHPGHLPCRLQNQHLLLTEYTSSHSCEVEVYFFKALPMVSLLTGTSSTIFACSSNSRSVQRECPSGAGLHAISIIRASARPSNFLLALSELILRSQTSHLNKCLCTLKIQ